jgi:hypothetical protein
MLVILGLEGLSQQLAVSGGLILCLDLVDAGLLLNRHDG